MIVAVFQNGWGASLIGVEETVPIMPLAPMLMFAILFGLSMDYEVFLMSRVREQYTKHLQPSRAVVEGLRRPNNDFVMIGIDGYAYGSGEQWKSALDNPLFDNRGWFS